jgi:hypothetical protein
MQASEAQWLIYKEGQLNPQQGQEVRLMDFGEEQEITPELLGWMEKNAKQLTKTIQGKYRFNSSLISVEQPIFFIGSFDSSAELYPDFVQVI